MEEKNKNDYIYKITIRGELEFPWIKLKDMPMHILEQISKRTDEGLEWAWMIVAKKFKSFDEDFGVQKAQEVIIEATLELLRRKGFIDIITENGEDLDWLSGIRYKIIPLKDKYGRPFLLSQE
jgi:hypothetical protein